MGNDYDRGAVEIQVPHARYESLSAGDRIYIQDPLPGTYRLEITPIQVHRNESATVAMFSGPRPERAALGLLPSILYLAPSDAPDLVAIQVSELTDAVDAGELTVQEIPSDHWRFSRSLDRGGTVILELRRPGDLFRDGVRGDPDRRGLRRGHAAAGACSGGTPRGGGAVRLAGQPSEGGARRRSPDRRTTGRYLGGLGIR